MAPVLLLRAMHVRIPLTRNNLLSFSPFSSSSYSFQFPATGNPVPAAFAGMCVHVLPEFIARGFAPLASMRPYSCGESRARRRKTFRDFSQSRCGNVREFQETPRRYIWQRETSLAPNRRQSRTSDLTSYVRAIGISLQHLYIAHTQLYTRFISLARKIYKFSQLET